MEPETTESTVTNDLNQTESLATTSNSVPSTTPNQVLLLVVIALISALITGLSVYAYQVSKIKNLKAEINQSSSETNESDRVGDNNEKEADLDEVDSQNKLSNKNSTKTTCVDSDVNEKPNDIFVKGSVTYSIPEGETMEVFDECSGSNEQVNEMWCYESPRGSKNYVAGNMVYDCPNGCLDGECLK